MAEYTDLQEVDSGHSSAGVRAREVQAPEKAVSGPDAELHSTEEKNLFQEEELDSEAQTETESLQYSADIGASVRKPDTGIKTGFILWIAAGIFAAVLICWKIYKKR